MMFKHSLPLKGKTSRPGFTLIELLVVISIIVALVALVAAGVMSWINGQARRNSETEVRTISTTLLRHWDVVVGDAKKEALLVGYTNANSDPWVKARLAEAFPGSFEEVNKAYIDPTFPTNLIQTKSRPKRYIAGYKTVTDKAGGSHNVNTESSALLLLALTVSREGVTNSADSFQPFTRDSDSDGIPEFVDGWGQPLYFVRNPLVQNQANLPANLLKYLQLSNTASGGLAPPIIFSAGPNLAVGLKWTPDPFPANSHTQQIMALNTADPDAAKYEDDNIYSFLIK